MNIRWLELAVLELAEIYHHIAADNPAAAMRVQSFVREAVSHLRDMPNRGRPGRWPDTRELVLTKYPIVIPYRIEGETIEIIRVLHTSRRPPEEL